MLSRDDILRLIKDKVHHPASARELSQLLRIPREERNSFKRHLKSLVTDGQGRGSMLYLPARTGRHELIARWPGREHLPDLEERFAFDATVAAPEYREAPVPLASFTAAVPYGVGAVVLSVWALIAFALFGSAIGIRRGRRDRHPIA